MTVMEISEKDRLWIEKWWEKRGYEPCAFEDMVKIYKEEFLRDWLRGFKED